MATGLPSLGRRSFITSLAATAAVLTGEPKARAEHDPFEPMPHGRTPDPRLIAYEQRVETAKRNRHATPPHLSHPTNGDECLYPNKIATYTKGLQHDDNGEVILSAYTSMMRALKSLNPADFEAISMGGPRRLVNPQAGAALELMGGDARSFVIPPPPAFASRECAAEMVEAYWMALLRDLPFSLYPIAPLAHEAAADLNLFGDDAKVPKTDGLVTPELLFRGLTTGDRQGPYLSQFFYQPFSIGANTIDQAVISYAAGYDYLTNYADYLAAQRGAEVPAPLLGQRVYLRNGRDIGRWVHVDVLYQAYFHAALVLLNLRVPLSPGNPYRDSRTQEGFCTLGDPAITGLLGEVAQRALRAVWFQKWLVHRRQRPEVFAARAHRTLYANASYPIHTDALESLSSASRLGRYLHGAALLPMAYPEGSPTHPAYGAGHATTAGACVTILKAWFDCSYLVPNPVQPSENGTTLVPYTGSENLSIEGELNKLASNVALGRNMAGVHWRSDATESLKLGEAIAIQYLRELKPCLNEEVTFAFNDFSGAPVVI